MSIYKQLLEAARESRRTLEVMDTDPFHDPKTSIEQLNRAIEAIARASMRRTKVILPHPDQMPIPVA